MNGQRRHFWQHLIDQEREAQTDPELVIAEIKRTYPVIQTVDDYQNVTLRLGRDLGVTDVRVVGDPEKYTVTILVGCAGKPPEYEAGITSALYSDGWAKLSERLPVNVIVFVHCMRDDAEALRQFADEQQGR